MESLLVSVIIQDKGNLAKSQAAFPGSGSG
jgi:hypothetical protein